MPILLNGIDFTLLFERISAELLKQLEGDGNGFVANIHRTLGAADDPIGVAAWWVQSNGYLPDNIAPIDMIDDATAAHVLVELAKGTVDL